MIKILFYFYIIFTLFHNLLVAGTPVILTDDKSSYEIGLNLDFLEDSTGKLTIDDVNNPNWANKFKKSKKNVLNFGFSKSTFWFRFIVKNKSDQRSWFINQNAVNLEEIDFFKKVDGDWKTISTGTRKSFTTRELEDKAFLFKIKPKNESIYFFKVKTVGSLW